MDDETARKRQDRCYRCRFLYRDNFWCMHHDEACELIEDCLVYKFRRNSDMDEKALSIVEDYIVKHLDKTDGIPNFDVYTVWKAKALQNWKYLISSTLPDGMYYELTYNGDKKEWYLDAYKKFENVVIPEEVSE